MSKRVSEKLCETLENCWPENYSSLFGSIDDETFDIEKAIGFSKEHKRESL